MAIADESWNNMFKGARTVMYVRWRRNVTVYLTVLNSNMLTVSEHSRTFTSVGTVPYV